jgi:hypothetical protein
VGNLQRIWYIIFRTYFSVGNPEANPRCLHQSFNSFLLSHSYQPLCWLDHGPPEIARNPIDPRWLFLRLQYVSFFRSVRPGAFAEPEVDGIGRLWGAIRRARGLWMFMGLCLWNWVFAGMRKEKG